MRVPVSPHPCWYLLISVIFSVAIIVSVEWDFIVVLICISLMVNDAEHLFCACCPFVYLPLMNVSSDSLPILKKSLKKNWLSGSGFLVLLNWVLCLRLVRRLQSGSGWNYQKAQLRKDQLSHSLVWCLGFPDSSVDKESRAMQVIPVRFLGQEDPLEKV